MTRTKRVDTAFTAAQTWPVRELRIYGHVALHKFRYPDIGADGILECITRDTHIKMAQDEMGVPTIERTVARTELYYADEVFLTGTGGQVATVVSVDRRKVADGQIGPISAQLQRLYFEIVKGRNPKYMDWLTPVMASQPARTTVPAS